MKTYQQIKEDSQDAGYSTTLETPRKLGPKDYVFVEMNQTRQPGETVIISDGSELEGSFILRNDPELFQYAHKENANEVHFESVELYRKLWVSIHIPEQSATYIGSL
ncbi:hypothetical protein ABNavy1_213 [Acinetobacter phage AB-Navy1]|nr:hypothetical protein AC4_217 [Acinetobacter phage AC4]UQS94035.1 hypothetical protein ABNavy1_213 [Acinetobacter phage AB-Navy1]CAH1068158.1 Uncharacterised protein [Acinetobacter phage MD-2021a]CAH1068946.1 Uncharacterised protein [Acinetobacter phage MD-2021a]